jgi:hypothetical protein
VIVTRTGWTIFVFGVRLEQFVWGVLGGAAALLFAIWMLFFPAQVPGLFAWDVHPRMAQAFIGAGYIFRTAFFLAVAFEPNWLRLRWLFWGNLAFTGTLLLATYWHMEEFHWKPGETIWAHVWLILYIYEPVSLLYLIPKGIRAVAAPKTGGPIIKPFRLFLIALTGVLLTNGLMLIINPDFSNTRWPWELNGLDARIIAAWFMGWAVWVATMAFAEDWDEIRLPAALFVLNGLALIGTFIAFGSDFRATDTAGAYRNGVIGLTVLMGGFLAYQEVRRRRLSRVTATWSNTPRGDP